ncbi:hypothetical protein BHE74_00014803 [Ensete ventricosum]|nr:hypothetical protein BHE74_00014803 [Ensete ventricosum]RZR81218.1 hypothetical protein BHM03_00007415 [Ensete ventricosum]
MELLLCCDFLSPFQITNRSLQFVSSLRKLEGLSMVGCSHIDDEGLQCLNNGSNSLQVNLGTSFPHFSFSSLFITIASVACQNSRRDSTAQEEKNIDQNLKILLILARQCQCHLQSFDVSRCENVTYSGLISVLEGHKYLQNLNIGDCYPDVKLVHLSQVPVEGFGFALRASGGRLKKLKLLAQLRHMLSPGLIQMLQAQGCRIRWVDKSPNFVP